MVLCRNKDCEYWDNGECGIVANDIDTLEISEDGECLCFEVREEIKV